MKPRPKCSARYDDDDSENDESISSEESLEDDDDLSTGDDSQGHDDDSHDLDHDDVSHDTDDDDALDSGDNVTDGDVSIGDEVTDGDVSVGDDNDDDASLDYSNDDDDDQNDSNDESAIDIDDVSDISDDSDVDDDDANGLCDDQCDSSSRCAGFPEAQCRRDPCTCRETFVDIQGTEVNCQGQCIILPNIAHWCKLCSECYQDSGISQYSTEISILETVGICHRYNYAAEKTMLKRKLDNEEVDDDDVMLYECDSVGGYERKQCFKQTCWYFFDYIGLLFCKFSRFQKCFPVFCNFKSFT